MVSKVVSVEDESEIAELLRIVLHHSDIELYTADNGPDGLTLIRTVKPDLVMLDVMMPQMNGWEVYDAIRADESLKDTPVIMLTVMREEPDRRRAFVGSEIDMYVTKPFDTVRLRREVERMLGQPGLWNVPKPAVALGVESGNSPSPPADSTPATPADSTPTAPTHSTPVDSTPTTPTHSTPTTPTHSTPTDNKPTTPPTDSKPVDSTPAKPEPAAQGNKVKPAPNAPEEKSRLSDTNNKVL